MIQVVPCPHCSRNTVLPANLSLAATIECPHCHERITLEELVSSALGTWIVVEDPGNTATAEGLESNDGGLHHHAEGDLTLADEETSSSSTETTKTDWSKFEPITHEDFERRRRQQRSPLWSIVQVVLGGLAAIPISLLLIWHVIGTDVGGAGPEVGKFLPWIVPEKFRPIDTEKVTRKTPEPGASGFRQFDLDVDPNTNAAQRSAQSMAMDEEVDLPGPEAAAETLEQSDESLASTPPRIDSEAQIVDDQVEGGDFAESPDLLTLIRDCERELDNWALATRDPSYDKRRQAQVIYGKLIAISSAIDQLPNSDSMIRAVRNQMQEIGSTINRRTDLQDLVSQGSRFWLDRNALPLYLAITIEIEQVELVESSSFEHWRILASPGSLQKDAEIRIPKQLAPSLQVGQRLLLLGHANADPEAGLSEIEAPTLLIFDANYLYAL